MSSHWIKLHFDVTMVLIKVEKNDKDCAFLHGLYNARNT